MNPDHNVDLAVRPGGGLQIEGYPTAVHLGKLSSAAAHRLRQREIQSHALSRLDAPLQLLGNLINGGFKLPEEWPPHDVIDALWTAIVVGYCRCFDSTQRNDSLDAEQVFAGKPDGLIVHQEICQLRDKHYAHDVNDTREVRVGVVLDANGANLDILRLASTWYHGMDQFQNLLNLVADAKAFVAEEITSLVKELADEVAAMTPEDRLRLPTLEFGPPKGQARRRRSS